jgi:hypothetical protein
MKALHLAVIASLALIGPSLANAAKARIVIENDHGGHTQSYIDKTVQQVPMEIRGGCYSACTIYLGNPKACFHPNAILYFHASSFDYAGNKPVRTRKPTWNERIATELYVMAYYPAKVKRWIKEHGGLKVTLDDMLELKGEELRQVAPICRDPARAAAIRSHREAVQRQALEELKTMGFKRSMELMTTGVVAARQEGRRGGGRQTD